LDAEKQTKTVLVADDELPLLNVLAAVLEYEGYRVVTATDGKEVLRRVSEEKPDVVLCDVMMPLMDGRDVYRTLRADPRYQHMPLVLMSAAYGSLELAGFDDVTFIAKPFDLDDIVQLVKRLADHAA
jgi:two-component system, OmpR family, alkaline phosphatase synthesis response regulator PhoP